MNSLDANTRNTKSKGDVSSLRLAGNSRYNLWGTRSKSKSYCIKKTLKSLIDKGSFLIKHNNS